MIGRHNRLRAVYCIGRDMLTLRPYQSCNHPRQKEMRTPYANVYIIGFVEDTPIAERLTYIVQCSLYFLCTAAPGVVLFDLVTNQMFRLFTK